MRAFEAGAFVVAMLLVALPALPQTAPRTAAPAPDLDALTSDQWLADVRWLAQKMPAVHVNLYHNVTPQRLNAAIADLQRSIPGADTDEVLVGIQRITALVGDAHSGTVAPLALGSRLNYPLQLWWYPNGIYVRGATAQYAAAVGGRVVRIGTTSIADVYRRVAEIVPQDAGSEARMRSVGVPVYLTSARVLHGLQITPTVGEASFVVEKDGHETTVRMQPTATAAQVMATARPDPTWVEVYDGATQPLPLWLKNPSKYYWYEYLPQSRTMYVQFNIVDNDPAESFGAFCRRLFDFVDRNPVERFVLDLRRNGGGNNYLLRPLIVGIVQAKQIDQRGKLYVLTGPRTFSAAQNAVNRLGLYTEAVFVGQSTGDWVNFYSDTLPIVLPNSKLSIGMSTVVWQDLDMRDKRVATDPDVAIDPSIDDLRLNRDAAMDWVLSHRYLGLEDVLRGSLPGGFDATWTAYRAWAAEPTNRYATSVAELRVNLLGYGLLADKRVADAIVVFRLNARAHPDSFNAFDSLGEAYATAGMRAEAIAAYERSVQLKPDSASGISALARLRSAAP
jgi:hypothetical protein